MRTSMVGIVVLLASSCQGPGQGTVGDSDSPTSNPSSSAATAETTAGPDPTGGPSPGSSSTDDPGTSGDPSTGATTTATGATTGEDTTGGSTNPAACGDGRCGPGESCASCDEDCGPCTWPPGTVLEDMIGVLTINSAWNGYYKDNHQNMTWLFGKVLETYPCPDLVLAQEIRTLAEAVELRDRANAALGEACASAPDDAYGRIFREVDGAATKTAILFRKDRFEVVDRGADIETWGVDCDLPDDPQNPNDAPEARSWAEFALLEGGANVAVCSFHNNSGNGGCVAENFLRIADALPAGASPALIGGDFNVKVDTHGQTGPAHPNYRSEIHKRTWWTDIAADPAVWLDTVWSLHGDGSDLPDSPICPHWTLRGIAKPITPELDACDQPPGRIDYLWLRGGELLMSTTDDGFALDAGDQPQRYSDHRALFSVVALEP